ncbi:AI-2E family transporter [Nocardioides ungokensis]
MSSDSAAATDGDSAAEPGDTAEAEAEDGSQDDSERDLGEPGAPLSRRSPFVIGFFAGLGLFLAWTLGGVIVSLSSVLIEIVVALFLAAGLNPLVEWFERRGMRRSFAVLTVISGVILALALFLVAIVPVITDQVTAISQTAPDWLTSFQRNHWVRNLDRQYDVIDKVKSYVSDGKFVSGLFGGVLGIGLAVLSVVLNSFVVTVMTLYFLASLDRTKHALYGLAPASRRDRVTKLGDEIIKRVGGYVSGAFIVALCAGISSLVFLFVVGMGQYAVALAFVVALLDVIPMIGATIGAVIVTAIGFATDPKIGLICIVFYVVYQQLENYVIYPRVMSKSVDVPGAVTVIAALIGASLLGVVGALLAIPTAAAILMLTREVFLRRQDAR